MKIHSLLAALLLLPSPAARAFDSRAWLAADGQMLEATFVRLLGDTAEVKAKDGRTLKLPKALLSIGDLDYLQSNAPQEKKPALGAATAVTKIPSPAKAAKVDRKQFKLAGELRIAARTWKVYETPHFKLLHLPPAEPADLAELAERMWLDAAFFYAGFQEKWTGRKMAIIMVNDDASLKDAMLSNGPDGTGAHLDRAAPEGSEGTLFIPLNQATAAGIFDYLRVLRGCDTPQAGKKPTPLKGVWRPCHVHMLALDLLGIQMGRNWGNVPEGRFALTAGTAFHKEILLTGRSETRIVGSQSAGRKLMTTGGFAAGKSWAVELKKQMKQGNQWKPSLDELMLTTENNAHTPAVVFSWSFTRFLQSTPERLRAFSQLCQHTDAAQQVPDTADIAKLYGFASAAELEKAWIAWMNSADFR